MNLSNTLQGLKNVSFGENIISSALIKSYRLQILGGKRPLQEIVLNSSSMFEIWQILDQYIIQI